MPSKMLVAAVNASLENERRLIAAAKLQRWEVVKWVVTVNGVLAAGAVTLLKLPPPPTLSNASLCVLLGVLAICVSGFGRKLIQHYDDRVGGARQTASRLEDELKKQGIDVRQITGQSDEQPQPDYDREELAIFLQAVTWSMIPALLVAAWALFALAVAVYRLCPGCTTLL